MAASYQAQGVRIGYARCSTDKQDLAAQTEALRSLGVSNEQIYTDHGLTGRNRKRPGLDQALAAVRAGDTLVVAKLDRLARSVPDARAIADELKAKGVKLQLGSSVHDPDDPMGKMFFNILATFAEFESDLIRMKTKEGMAIARAKGKLRGKTPKLTDMQAKELRRMYDRGGHSIADLASVFGVSRPTVYRTLKKDGSMNTDAKKLEEISKEHLGHYVYQLADPRDGKVFYVGKGQGARLFSHQREAEEAEAGERDHTAKTRRIAELLQLELEPDWTILSRNHSCAESAEVTEAAVMMALSLSQNGPVLNLQSGQHGATCGALRQDDLQGLAAEPVDPGVRYELVYIFPIGNSLARGESLYDATRRAWRVAEPWRKPVPCVGLDGGLSKAVFAAEEWHEVGNDGKHEFVGKRDRRPRADRSALDPGDQHGQRLLATRQLARCGVRREPSVQGPSRLGRQGVAGAIGLSKTTVYEAVAERGEAG